MKRFLLATFLIAALMLLIIDLRIQKNTALKERVLLQNENQVLAQRHLRIESEIQSELADPDLQLFIVEKMKFHRDHTKSYILAEELKHGRTDTRRVDAHDESPSTP
jgi:hypothetical protein